MLSETHWVINPIQYFEQYIMQLHIYAWDREERKFERFI